MALTKFDIITRATTKLGAEKVNSFDDETVEAQVAQQLYEPTVQAEMSSGYWNCCRKTFELSRDVTAPTDANWQYQFQLPADYLQVEKAISETGQAVTYQIEGRKVLSNSQRLFLQYLVRIDENDWPIYLQDVIVSRLTWQFSEPLNGEGSTIARALAEYERSRRDARRIDSQQTPPQTIINNGTAVWVTSREGW
ncbi:MAG: hypothetical protein H9535_19355 [Ignavibacteria bacterium]|nr:hypothetical protein [Ignavibacteria bacterium]